MGPAGVLKPFWDAGSSYRVITNMRSKKAKKIILIAVGTLCALVCAACGVFLYQFYRGAQSKTELTQQVRTVQTPEAALQPVEDAAEDAQEPSIPDAEPEEEDAEPAVLPVEIPIDFEQLAAVSPDIYAWLEVPDTQIDEPVLQHAGDDLYYNSHNAYGEYYMCGAVFSQETYNDRTFDAPITILYGHGTVLGQPGAFHELNSYADEEYFDAHRQMIVYTPSAMYVYRVFAAFVHGREHLLYYYDFSDPAIFSGFFHTVRQSADPAYSHFDDSCWPEPGDQVLALSTCFEPDKNRRYLVMGVLEEVHPAAGSADAIEIEEE